MEQKYRDFLKWTVYQIYPRSFCDSNNDGIGDLNGVISKLDYLAELGVNAIWLCPCYKSPNKDNGYDIADYRDIMDEFGTMDDIKRLISEMHSRGMKLIMDLVPNHTSDRHRWFQESRKSKDNPYSDYYYWVDEPLNDWTACFGGSVWQYDEMRGQYYLHSYTVEQPDLNWDNPKVVKEMQDVVDFWVDLGVDGFRCDVIDQISKNLPDGTNCFGPRLHEYINALFGREKTSHIFTVGECWCHDIEEIRKHSAEERGELTTLFQFDHTECGRYWKYLPKEDNLKSVRDILVKWETLSYENDLIYSLFTDNHDNNFLLSRVANDKELRYEAATCMASMFYMQKGVPFIYQGQEFGMTASHYDSIEDFDDVESVNFYQSFLSDKTPEEALELVNFGSRDNARHPMAWNAEENSGFSEHEPWIKPYSRYKEINLAADRASEKSVFEFYKKLLKLRAESDTVLYGDLEVLSRQEDNYFVFTREYNGNKIGVVCNFDSDAEIKLPFKPGKVLLSNYNREDMTEIGYKPYETVIFEI